MKQNNLMYVVITVLLTIILCLCVLTYKNSKYCCISTNDSLNISKQFIRNHAFLRETSKTWLIRNLDSLKVDANNKVGFVNDETFGNAISLDKANKLLTDFKNTNPGNSTIKNLGVWISGDSLLNYVYYVLDGISGENASNLDFVVAQGIDSTLKHSPTDSLINTLVFLPVLRDRTDITRSTWIQNRINNGGEMQAFNDGKLCPPCAGIWENRQNTKK